MLMSSVAMNYYENYILREMGIIERNKILSCNELNSNVITIAEEKKKEV